METADSKILVVDDNEDNRYTLIRRLKRTGYEDVTEAVDGEDALARLATTPFDLVLLDVMMPKVNGYQVLEQMKADPERRDIPVIMISALSELDSVVRCIELGAEDYLPKPFNPVLLKARISACLEKKKLRDHEQAHLAEIDAQRRRADELLHVILPEKAVIELKQHDRVSPRRYDNVALLFCDIIDFTSYCDKHAAEEVVANLGLVMEAWEEVIAHHGLEKITSIGDGVFATANLLNEHPDPVAACVKCAFPLIDAAAKSPANWGLRVGVHTGSVIAGVVGRSKFRFDVCGDAVNVTARLSDLGSEPKVYLTGEAWQKVQERCDGRSLGSVAIKGKQEMEVVECFSIKE